MEPCAGRPGAECPREKQHLSPSATKSDHSKEGRTGGLEPSAAQHRSALQLSGTARDLMWFNVIVSIHFECIGFMTCSALVELFKFI